MYESATTLTAIRHLKNYLQLTKPSIMLLVIITGATALIIEGSLLHEPFRFLLVLLSLYLTGGSANALNQYFERDIDARMSRTSKRRPLPQGMIKPSRALFFSIGIGVTGVLIFGFVFNWLTALLSLATILFYSLFYTLLLKPNTTQNIVIGGIAGAMAPVGAWAAATGRMDIVPWILFLIVFLWTPPHFWALALFYKEDYHISNLPMLPVVKGDDVTLQQIVVYSILMVISSLLFFIFQAGWFYLIIASATGIRFVFKSIQAKKYRTEKHFRGLFGYSIAYLFILFIAMVIDEFITRLHI
jgi:protoheme IX farnesyltransferase